MQILEGGTILECKSTPDNWNAEKMNVLTQGSKRNTVRFVNPHEHETLSNSNLKFIRVVNTEDAKLTFLRKLTDYRPFEYEHGKWVWLFSW